MDREESRLIKWYSDFQKQLVVYINRLQCQEKYAFILGHMRSGSTLLLHLLASHPEIIAGGERNKTYHDIEDLNTLALDICKQQRIILSHGKIIIDQINHEKMTPNIDVLNYPGLKRIFLLRRPEETISSIVNTFEPLYGNWPVERGTEYYISRINNIEQIAKGVSLPDNSILIKYEDLIEESSVTLERLQKFLNLKHSLSTTYKLYRYTGYRGDPSNRIKSGKILKVEDRVKIDIPSHLLNEAVATYNKCLSSIENGCVD
jgi:hypothetical protein